MTKYRWRRSVSQAVGFYIVYLIFAIVVANLFGGVIGLFFHPDSLAFSTFIGRFFEMGIVTGVGYAILSRKNLLNNYLLFSLIILGVIITYFFGSIVGLIPIAYLTTREANKKKIPHVTAY